MVLCRGTGVKEKSELEHRLQTRVGSLDELTFRGTLEKELLVLHLKVSWRSGLSFWNNMQVMPFQSPALIV